MNLSTMHLLLISLAPVFMILVYIYLRDKYEKEPVSLLLKGILAGIIITLPIILAEKLVIALSSPYVTNRFSNAFTHAFLAAALCEEGFKFLALYLLIWRNKNFDEYFDGIVYAVFVSLGFALVENILYVFNADNGMQVGLLRAFTAVPGHAMFGILMGYQLSKAKFSNSRKQLLLLLSFLLPFLFHGLYDFLIMSNHPVLLFLFIPFFIWMISITRKEMRTMNNKDLIHKP